MAKGAEERLLEQIEDALSDIRFSLYLFGQMATKRDFHSMRSRIFGLCTAFIEMFAIHGDTGDFSPHERDDVSLAMKLRDEIKRHRP